MPPGSGDATLAELSEPRNCFCVALRSEVTAAIKTAADRLAAELASMGVRRVHLYELVEGGCQLLSQRFAEFVGHVLQQARSSTGISSQYVGRDAIVLNISQGRIALGRLSRAVVAYVRAVPRAPAFGAGLAPLGPLAPGTTPLPYINDLRQEREAHLERASRVTAASLPPLPGKNLCGRGVWW